MHAAPDRRTILRLGGAGLAAMCLPPISGAAGAESAPVPPWDSALQRDHPLVGTIHAPGSGTTSPVQMTSAAAERSFVILGERHDNPDHHRIQAWLLRQLIAQGRRPAVVFEMVTEADQPAIDAFLARNPADAAELGQAVDWDDSGWPDWSMYRPIADIAVAHDLPIIAGNAPRENINTVVKRGGLDALDATSLAELRLAEPVGKPHLAELRRDIREGHCDMLPEKMIAPMAAAQRLRDATMAEAMVAASKRTDVDGAVLITGNGHARRDRGVPFYLQRHGLDPQTIYSIAPVEAEADLERPAQYGEERGGDLAYDAVWFTPRAEREDPCARMRRQAKEGPKGET